MAQPRGLEGRRIHFMGAGGIGVSAMLNLAQSRGAWVSGCDCMPGGQLERLAAEGVQVYAGHDPSHLAGCDTLVYSAAVRANEPELLHARALGLQVLPRMDFLGQLLDGVQGVCVTGSHGKTTTTWMIGHLLLHANRDPAILVGGVAPGLASNVRVRSNPSDPLGGAWVVEVDESDNRLHAVKPVLPILTNLDRDHMEHYGSLEALCRAAEDFLASTRRDAPGAALIGCGDDPLVRRALDQAQLRTGLPKFSYGFGAHNRFRITQVRYDGMRSVFELATPHGVWTELELPMPGRHNVLNAAGALAAGWRLGLSPDEMRDALRACGRVGRRFEIIGEANGVRVVDDYGHHPAEIQATLDSALSTSEPGGRVGVLFEPHRYTRTRDLMAEFAECFYLNGAEAVWVLPVYAASEDPIPGATHADLAAAIRALGHPCAQAVSSAAEAVAEAARWARPGDTLVTQGAGSITKSAPKLVDALRTR